MGEFGCVRGGGRKGFARPFAKGASLLRCCGDGSVLLPTLGWQRNGDYNDEASDNGLESPLFTCWVWFKPGMLGSIKGLDHHLRILYVK